MTKAKKKVTAKKATAAKATAQKATVKSPVKSEMELKMEAIMAEMEALKASNTALETANSALTDKLCKRKAKAGLSTAEKQELEGNMGILLNIHGAYRLVNRNAIDGEKLQRRIETRYFSGDSVLRDCKKAKKEKDPAIIAEAVKVGVNVLKELYPERSFNADIDSVINELTKARSAKRVNNKQLQHGSSVSKGTSVIRAYSVDNDELFADIATLDAENVFRVIGFNRSGNASDNSATVTGYSKTIDNRFIEVIDTEAE